MVNISTVKKKKIVNSIAEIEGSVYFQRRNKRRQPS